MHERVAIMVEPGMKGGPSIEHRGTCTKIERRLPPLSLVVGMQRRCRSLAHLEHEFVDFVITVGVESEQRWGLGWSVQLRLSERNNFPTLENVANCISLAIYILFSS